MNYTLTDVYFVLIEFSEADMERPERKLSFSFLNWAM